MYRHYCHLFYDVNDIAKLCSDVYIDWDDFIPAESGTGTETARMLLPFRTEIRMPGGEEDVSEHVDGLNVSWCTDWDAYNHDPSVPSITVIARHDITNAHGEYIDPVSIYEHMGFIEPVKLTKNIVMATGCNNRACCFVLQKILDRVSSGMRDDRDRDSMTLPKQRSLTEDDVPIVINLLWADGMDGVEAWHDAATPYHYVKHSREMVVVLEADEVNAQEECMGNGCLMYKGDPAVSFLDSDSVQFLTSATYPESLHGTVASPFYDKWGFANSPDHMVSRMGVPVYRFNTIGTCSCTAAVSTKDIGDLEMNLKTLIEDCSF